MTAVVIGWYLKSGDSRFSWGICWNVSRPGRNTVASDAWPSFKARRRWIGAKSLVCTPGFKPCSHDAEVGFQFARVRWTCLVHKSHKCGSFGKRKSEKLSLGMFPQAAATQRFGMMLLDEYKRPKTQYTHVHNNVNRRGKYGRMSISGRIYLLWWRRSRLPPLSAREKARCSNLCNFLDFTKLLFFGLF